MPEYDLKGVTLTTKEGAELDDADQIHLTAVLCAELSKLWKVESVGADPPIFKLKKS